MIRIDCTNSVVLDELLLHRKTHTSSPCEENIAWSALTLTSPSVTTQQAQSTPEVPAVQFERLAE